MKRSLGFVLLMTAVLFMNPNLLNSKRVQTMTAEAADKGAEKTEETEEVFDWDPVMDAIIQVESRGNRLARNGNQVGCMQITPACVAECNAILRQQGINKKFTLQDRYSIEKSKEMFLVIQSKYNPDNSVEFAIRAWNGGIRYSVRGTQRYFEKVMSHLLS